MMFHRLVEALRGALGLQVRVLVGPGEVPPRLDPSRVKVTLTREPTCGTLNPPAFRWHASPDPEGIRWQASCRSSLPYPYAPQVRVDTQGNLSLEEYGTFLDSLESAGVWEATSGHNSLTGGEIVTLTLHLGRRVHTVEWLELPGRMENRADAEKFRGPRHPGTERVRCAVNASFIDAAWKETRKGYKGNLWHIDEVPRR